MSGGVGTAIEIGASFFEADEQEDAAAAKEAAIRQRQNEERIRGEQLAVARDRQVETLIGHQVAAEAASGFELSSQSFKAITMQDFNNFAQTRRNDKIELQLKENQLQEDIEQTKSAVNAQVFGDALHLAGSLFSDSGGLSSVSNMPASKVSTVISASAKDEFDDATVSAKEKRQSGEGLFDNVGT